MCGELVQYPEMGDIQPIRYTHHSQAIRITKFCWIRNFAQPYDRSEIDERLALGQGHSGSAFGVVIGRLKHEILNSLESLPSFPLAGKES